MMEKTVWRPTIPHSHFYRTKRIAYIMLRHREYFYIMASHGERQCLEGIQLRGTAAERLE